MFFPIGSSQWTVYILTQWACVDDRGHGSGRSVKQKLQLMDQQGPQSRRITNLLGLEEGSVLWCSQSDGSHSPVTQQDDEAASLRGEGSVQEETPV